MSDGTAIPAGVKADRIRQLEILADEMKGFLKSRKRPLLVEFSGLPKAGKTTSVNSLALFLRRNKINVHVVTERASVCPIKEKHHPFFNIWTGCTTLANILDSLQSREHTVVVVDRGLYDALVWLQLLSNIGRISEEELGKIEDFFLMGRWARQIDLVIQMRTTPEEALEREFAHLLTEKEGSVMNKPMLQQYLKAAEETSKRLGSQFRKLVEVDTSAMSTIDGVEQITREVLTGLKELSDERLAVIPKPAFLERYGAGFHKDARRLRAIELMAKSAGAEPKRSQAEQDPNLIQLVACAFIQYRNQILLFTKREVSSSQRFHGKQMLWIGGHVTVDDLDPMEVADFRAGILRTLKRELEEEISFTFKDADFKGFVYDQTHEKSMRHLGLVFRIQVDDPVVMSFLDRRTFREYAGQELATEFVEIDAIKQRVKQFEPWSAEILHALFKVEIPAAKTPNQLLLV
jgi:predicted NUDIX family phosphoesterase/thymidylate kinase